MARLEAQTETQFETRFEPKRGCTALHRVELPRSTDLLSAADRLQADCYPWLLDSALTDSRLGRSSFAGSDPYLVVRAFGDRIELDCRRAVRPGWTVGRSVVEHDPLDVVRQLLPPPPPPDASSDVALPFVGGAVGYWGYELAQQIEPVRLHGWNDLGLADLALLFVDRVLAVDHGEGRAFALGLGFAGTADAAARRARRAAEALAARVSGVGAAVAPAIPRRDRLLRTGPPASLEAHFDESGYAKAVTSILEEIEAGNVYQADLTQRMDLPFAGDPWALYRRLRAINPAPFAAYLGLPEVQILSSSPERFVRVTPDGDVESRPIKGTRPRGATPAEDARLEAELAGSEKDRAENLMIVDLVRSDLGRVCRVGSIEVPELMAIERYASVFQMVSTVTGRLRPDRDATDLLRAAFPPGSMTGAPKIAAMQILDRLEPVRRGVYSGALGYLDVRGGADLSVVIRTLLVREGRAYLHVGGGIVADSDPLAEYRETLDKARALFAALASA
ncbi:MAG: aminodeoxychorismate synthase component I [Proteobacteria bacterium]|nr:aminodeoxychorismate synthase component I [Pseudomonadota bacterium]